VLAAQDQVYGSVNLVVPLLALGRWAAHRHAGTDVEVARRGADDVARQLTTAVAHTFVATRTERRVVEIAERALATADAHYAFAHRRLLGRYGSRLDDLRAAQETASTAAALEDARGRLFRLQETLGALVGVGRALDPVDDPELPEIATDQASLAQAVRARSDVRLAARRLEAAQQVVGDDWLDHAPVLLGTVQQLMQKPGTLTQPSRGWQAQLVLSLPLFEGGLRVATSREHRALRDRRQAELEALLLAAGADARAAAGEVTHARAARVSAERAARLAEEALSLAVLAYREGATTNLEVIDAERRARDAATASAVAQETFHRALLDLLTATGRFPQGFQDQSLSPPAQRGPSALAPPPRAFRSQ
jgi:outer membrane protein TolC